MHHKYEIHWFGYDSEPVRVIYCHTLPAVLTNVAALMQGTDAAIIQIQMRVSMTGVIICTGYWERYTPEEEWLVK